MKKHEVGKDSMGPKDRAREHALAMKRAGIERRGRKPLPPEQKRSAHLFIFGATPQEAELIYTATAKAAEKEIGLTPNRFCRRIVFDFLAKSK